jgi:hypothetical protein
MITEILIGICFFAGVAAILSVPWMHGVDTPADDHHDEHPAEHH